MWKASVWNEAIHFRFIYHIEDTPIYLADEKVIQEWYIWRLKWRTQGDFWTTVLALMPHLLEVMNSFKCIHNSYPIPFVKQLTVSDSPLGFGSSGLGGEGGIVNSWRIKHPVVTFFHLLFRTLAIIGKSIIGCRGRYHMKSKWLLLPKTSNLQPICYAAGSLMASLEALWQSYFSSRSTFGQSKI